MLMAQAACSDLIISEYIEGSGNNKAIELYNPTNDPIDLLALNLLMQEDYMWAMLRSSATIANIFYQEFMARFALGVPLALNETDQVKSSLIYPNPSPGQFTVRLNEALQGPVSLNIYNHIGQLVFQADEKVTPGTAIKLNLSNLDAGIYFLKVTGNKLRCSEKLVIIP